MAAGDVDARITTLRAMPCNVFDGVDDYVEIPHNDNQLGANLAGGFTISAWINPGSVGETRGHIFDKSSGAGGDTGFRFAMDEVTPPKVSFTINASNVTRSGNTSTPYGVWTHVLVTINDTPRSNFYVNGVLSGTANQTVNALNTITTTNAMRIGNRSAATDRSFDGSIRSVKMWNKVLSADEIAADYAGQAVATDRLIVNVPLGGSYGGGTNSGSIPQIVDDSVATAIKAQRALTGISGAFMIAGTKGGQIYSVGVQKT
jgi:hypothetical protein